MPNIRIRSITLEKTNIEPGDSIAYEVCIENEGDAGDINLYTGFGYMVGTTIHYIGNGGGHGYWFETIGAVEPGEYFCPYEMVEMPDEALILQNQGKDIRFYAYAIPGNSMSQDVTVLSPPCTQQFRLEDQNGNPLSGTLIIGGKNFDVTGDISLLLETGTEYIARAEVGDVPKQAAFMACKEKIIFKFTITEQCTQQFRLEDQNGNPLSGTLIIGGQNFDVTGDISLLLETGTEYIARAEVGDVPKQAAFMACKEKIIFKFTIEKPKPTLTTSIVSQEPYVAGTSIDIKTVLKSQNGVPILGKKVFFYNINKEFLGAGFTNASGEVTIPLQTTSTPSTYEIYTTHLTDDNIFVESNHITFTTTEDTTYKSTSLSISIDPVEIGPSQYADITGKLTIQGQDQILPGIPVKLYCDKGTGYQLISTPTTPASGTGTFIFHYGAQQYDVGKTLKFKYIYDGSNTLKLNSSESGIVELTVSSEPILIETVTTLLISPAEIKPGNTLILKAKITEKDTGNTLPVGTFVHFYIGTTDLGISGTINDGYAYSQFIIPADYIGPYVCKAKYGGIVNKYGSSESTSTINVNPECVEHETESACTDADCHWWSDETCKSYAEPPPESTGSIGFIIKPHSWYAGNTEQAVIDLTAKTSDIISAMTKYFTSFIDIEFVSIDIYQDKNIDRVILKIYYKETSIQTMVAPVALAGIAIGAISAIFVVTAVIGWVESWFADDDIDHTQDVPPDKIIGDGQDGIDDAGDDAAGNVYNIDDDIATTLNDCLAAAETVEDITECYGLVSIPDENNTDTNAETFGIAKWTAALAVLYTLCEALQDQIYCDKADELDTTLNVALTDFRAGTTTKEQFLLTVTQELNIIDDFLQQKEEEAKEEREDYATDHCFIVNPGYPITSDNPCIITNTQAAVGGAVIGLGIIGLFILRR